MGSAIQPEDEDMKIGIVGAGQIGGTLTPSAHRAWT